MFIDEEQIFDARRQPRIIALSILVGGVITGVFLFLMPELTGLHDPFLNLFLRALGVFCFMIEFVMAFLFFYFCWGGIYKFSAKEIKIIPDNFGLFVSGAPKAALPLTSLQFLRISPAGFDKMRLWLHFKGKKIPIILGAFDTKTAEQHVEWFKSNDVPTKET